MKRAIQEKDKIKPEVLNFYEEIDGMAVIEELLLFKGENIVLTPGPQLRVVRFSLLEEMVLIKYGLKSNTNNKMYAGWYLEKFYRQNGMIYQSQQNNQGLFVIVPTEIYNKAKELNDHFRNLKK